jgi:hypothetical protein
LKYGNPFLPWVFFAGYPNKVGDCDKGGSGAYLLERSWMFVGSNHGQ